jgi:ABC-type dipeptide/oligopeptide/nickel transport system permease subunit
MMGATTLQQEPALLQIVRPRNQWRVRLYHLTRRKLAVVGGLLVIAEVLLALIGPVVSPYDPTTPNFDTVLQPPNLTHWLGTDDLGRDVLSRLLTGARLSLLISVTSIAIAAIVGVGLGIVSGYLGGALDELLMRILDSFMALPSLVLALVIAAVLGPGLMNATIAIAVAGVPIFARLVRGQTLSIKEHDYILAAHASGASSLRMLLHHVLPNALGPVIVQASLGLGFAIITESSLSFIGLGVQPPTPTWGSMVQVGFQFLETAPWYVLAPATSIFLGVLSFNLLGDGLRDAMA